MIYEVAFIYIRWLLLVTMVGSPVKVTSYQVAFWVLMYLLYGTMFNSNTNSPRSNESRPSVTELRPESFLREEPQLEAAIQFAPNRLL